MSSSVYPVLPGLQWPVVRSIVTETTRRRTASGRSFRTTSWTYPVLRYRLSYEFLRRSASFTEYEQLAAFFVQMLGGYDNFLYTDPTDNAVTNQIIGTGDGTRRDFALLFPLGSAAIPIGSVNVLNQITINGTPNVLHAILEGRIVRFDTAPAAGAVVRWTGSHYMRCFFTDDVLDLEEFMSGFHSADGVEFETEKG